MGYIIGIMVVLVVLWLALELFKRKYAAVKGKKFKDSATLQKIQALMFSNGAPAQINLTNRNEIFYGPFGSQGFSQVPPEMVPQMSYDDQYALGRELAGRTGYLMYNRSDRNLKTTGDAYIDGALTMQLVTRGQSAAKW